MDWSFFSARNRFGRNQFSAGRKRGKLSKARKRRPLFEVLEQRRVMAVLMVNAPNAQSDTTAADGFLTLREALAVVSTHSTATLSTQELAQVNLTTPLGANDSIQFASGVTAVTLGTSGQLEIGAPVSIDGTSSVSITAFAGARIFHTTAGIGDVSIKGLSLLNGVPGAGAEGGAIFSEALGTLTVANSVLTGNSSVNGGAIFAVGDLVVNGSTIGGAGVLGNSAGAGKGGAIYGGGTITISNSTITGNTAASGGGVYGIGNILLSHSLLTANTATTGTGGGILGLNTVDVENSTVGGPTLATDGNRASTSGGGIFAQTVTVQYSAVSGNKSGANGGGIYAQRNVVVRNSTISGNIANNNGGGIYNPFVAGSNRSVTLQNATVASNIADADATGGGMGGGLYAGNTLTVLNSIIIGNKDNLTGALINPDFVSGVSNNIQYSLIGDAKGVTVAVVGALTPGPAYTPNGFSNIVGTSAGGGTPIDIALVLDSSVGVAVLKDNNTPQPKTTPTIALVTNSLAIDKGFNKFVSNPSAGDQRGTPFVRISPFNGLVDMGAYEAQVATALNTPPVGFTITNQSATVGVPFGFSVTPFFSDADSDVLIYTATLAGGGQLPAWLTFNSTTGAFAGIPATSDIGAIQIKVTASDQKSLPASLPSETFTLTVAAPTTTNVTTELPFSQNFDGTVTPPNISPDSRISAKAGAFSTVTTNPINGTGSLFANRTTQGERPLATVDFNNPVTPANIKNISAVVSPAGGNGKSLWSNAVIAFDYQDPNNYKFAGVFEIIDKLIIGQVVNGKVTYLVQQKFATKPNDLTNLNVAIDRTTNKVTVTANSTVATSYTYKSIGTGTAGVGTINSNARFDLLTIT